MIIIKIIKFYKYNAYHSNKAIVCFAPQTIYDIFLFGGNFITGFFWKLALVLAVGDVGSRPN